MEQLVFDLSGDISVFQSNSLAMAKYDMSSLEQKVFLILVATIKKEDKEFKNTVFKIVDLAELMGVSPQMLYRDLKKLSKSIVSKSIEIKSENGDWEVINIVSSAKYKSNSGTIELKINKDAEPYLLQLQKLFTSFKLENALNLDGKYAIRIYQQAKSNIFSGGTYLLELEEFKNQLKLTQKSYQQFSNINLKVLTPAINEINEKTDIDIQVEPKKVGRKVVALKFQAKNKDKQKVIFKNSKEINSGNYTSNNSKLLGKSEMSNKRYNEIMEHEKMLLGLDE